MRIDGTSNSSGVRSTSKTDKKKKSGDTAFEGLVEDTAGTEEKKPVAGAAAINNIDALLSLQESGGGTSEEAVRKARLRAAALLDHLDQVRMGILTGGIPKSSLQQLSRTISTHRETVMDPALAQILDEIDLRAQVELAKHNR